MKTLAQILVIAGLASFVACGPSAEQKAEQARLDSIRIADSIAMVQQAEQARRILSMLLWLLIQQLQLKLLLNKTKVLYNYYKKEVTFHLFFLFL
jgi:hypothetical protein